MGEPMMKILSVRYHPDEYERWKQAAELKGVSVGELARTLLIDKAGELLDCQHVRVKSYPWSAICLDCGVRLRG